MEDEFSIVGSFTPSSGENDKATRIMLGCYDGHGGGHASKVAKESLHKHLAEYASCFSFPFCDLYLLNNPVPSRHIHRESPNDLSLSKRPLSKQPLSRNDLSLVNLS